MAPRHRRRASPCSEHLTRRSSRQNVCRAEEPESLEEENRASRKQQWCRPGRPARRTRTKSHLNIQRNHRRLWVLDPHQSSQVVETPCSPDVKVFQDGGILKLNLLDVVIEVQGDQRLYGSIPEQLSLSRFRVAWRAPARIVLRPRWFIAAWIISGAMKHGVWNC